MRAWQLASKQPFFFFPMQLKMRMVAYFFSLRFSLLWQVTMVTWVFYMCHVRVSQSISQSQRLRRRNWIVDSNHDSKIKIRIWWFLNSFCMVLKPIFDLISLQDTGVDEHELRKKGKCLFSWTWRILMHIHDLLCPTCTYVKPNNSILSGAFFPFCMLSTVKIGADTIDGVIPCSL